MKATCSKIPIAWKLQLTIDALIPEFKQLRDLLEENKTFVPDLIPLLEELNIALTGWRELINGPCGSSEPIVQNIGSEPDKPFVLYDETRDRLVALDKNSELGLR